MPAGLAETIAARTDVKMMDENCIVTVDMDVLGVEKNIC